MPDPLQEIKPADIAVIAVAVCLPTVVTALYFLWPSGNDSTVVKLLYGGGKVVQFGLPLVWVLLVKKQSLDMFEHGFHSVLAGVIFGLMVASAMALLYFYALAGTPTVDGIRVAANEKLQQFGLTTPWKYLLLAVFYTVVHSGLEEYYYRWFIYDQTEVMSTFAIAVAVSSIGFAAHHLIVLGVYFGWNNPWPYFLTCCIAVGGVVWAYLYERSDSPIGVWVSHGIVDAAIFAIGWHLISSGGEAV
jgi:membrane protease YdiL (CAAX protease family)